MFGWMDREPVPVPEAGETASQLVLVEAVQVKVPVPELEMETLCAAGLELPAVAAKDNAAEPTLNAGLDVGGGVVPLAGATWIAFTRALRVTPLNANCTAP